MEKVYKAKLITGDRCYKFIKTPFRPVIYTAVLTKINAAYDFKLIDITDRIQKRTYEYSGTKNGILQYKEIV